MSQPVENKILSRIYGRGRGWTFTKTDFVAEFGESNVHKALSSLTKSGKIRRVLHGVYDYPRYSDLLSTELARPGSIKLVPEGHVLANVERDYRSMGNMIFGEIPSVEEIMSCIEVLEEEINSLQS